MVLTRGVEPQSPAFQTGAWNRHCYVRSASSASVMSQAERIALSASRTCRLPARRRFALNRLRLFMLVPLPAIAEALGIRGVVRIVHWRILSGESNARIRARHL